jgi:hypothetical protein
MKHIVFCLALLFVIGTASALELGNISPLQAILQAIIGLSVMFLSERSELSGN